MNLNDAEYCARILIHKHVPHYRFAWMNEKTVNGRCNYDRKTIYLSTHLTKLRTEDAVKQTIMHEIAHALTQGDGHGNKWKAQMRKFGYVPERCSSDTVDKSSISNWVAFCKRCQKKSYFIRKPRVERSCGRCHPGKYNKDYALTYSRI